MAEPRAGARLGDYTLLAQIGAGGMGQVWVALDERAADERLVAIKVALNEEGADPKYWATLADEANVAARIQHPNVCATYGLGQQDDVRFLVMEWSNGTSLRELLDASPGKRLPVVVAAQLGARVAAGLHAAHQLTDDAGASLELVHRDVSPQNVLLDIHGRVRLADFGVAKARGQLRRATETGEIKGKLSYMAPEQISGRAIDARADVFALGCLVYEAALGVRVFHGNDALSTMYQILEQAPRSPREVDPAFPQQLEAVLLKALEKNPTERYQSAAELEAALLDSIDENVSTPGDRHLAKLIDSTLGPAIASRNSAFYAAAAKARRGEALAPLLDLAPPSHSHTPNGLALNEPARAEERRNGWWLVGIAATVAVVVLASWRLAQRAPNSAKPPTSQAARPAVAPPSPPLPVASEVLPAPSMANADAAPSASVSAAVARPKARAPARPSAVATPPDPQPTRPGEFPRSKPMRPPRTIDNANPFTE